MNSRHYVRKLIFAIAKTYREIKAYFESPLRLEEIDTDARMVVLRSRGARAILKISIAEAVTDPLVLSNLLPMQACWLGYYAGQLYGDLGVVKKNIFSGSRAAEFKLHFKKGRYKITSQNRRGDIEYIDTHKNVIYRDLPLRIARNNAVISHFDPSQACYIGVLAGMEMHKAGKRENINKKSKAELRIVK